METLISLFVWGVIGYFIYTKFFNRQIEKEKTSYNNKPSGFISKSTEQKDMEAREVADSIKTHKGIEGLENRIDALSDKMDDYHFDENDLMYEKTQEKQEILKLALVYAGENPYRYYYCLETDVDTPLEELKLVGKTISRQKYNELSNEQREFYDAITLEETDSVEEANEYAKDMMLEDDEMKDLKSYRKIMESDLNDKEREEAFNKLVSKSDYLMENLYLEVDEDMSLYKQYLRNEEKSKKREKLGDLPYAYTFIDNGYETIEEISSLSDKDILSMYGIGKKSLEEIRVYLNSLKSA